MSTIRDLGLKNLNFKEHNVQNAYDGYMIPVRKYANKFNLARRQFFIQCSTLVKAIGYVVDAIWTGVEYRLSLKRTNFQRLFTTP